MGANKLEAFTIEVVNRKDIHGADYNPRKITESAKKKLRKFLKENGLWEPLILNKRTMTLVSGHQRLSIMDSLLRKDDYDLTMSIIDVDEKLEVSGNVFMNITSRQWANGMFSLYRT
jgi:ParB-like chromosome segregation protein Spo0J